MIEIDTLSVRFGGIKPIDQLTAENLDLPSTECESPVFRIAARAGIGEGRQAKRERVRTHVPTVCQHGHRVEPPSAGDLHNHHCQRQPHGATSISLGERVSFAEGMGMAPTIGNNIEIHGQYR